MPEPAANGAVGNRSMVQDDERSHYRAQAIDVEIAECHEPSYVGPRRSMRGPTEFNGNQYFTIAVNESGLRLAPPTSAPSISSWPISEVALSGFTLPP